VTHAALAARVLATWFGCGRAPLAPGTVGSLGAVPLHVALAPLHPALHAAVVLALCLCGTWAAERAAEAEKLEDPQSVVIDEVCGTLIAMGLVASSSWPFKLLALALFRVFDIMKPGPIDSLQHLRPAGLGIMADDVMAGVAAGLMAWSASALLSP